MLEYSPEILFSELYVDSFALAVGSALTRESSVLGRLKLKDL